MPSHIPTSLLLAGASAAALIVTLAFRRPSTVRNIEGPPSPSWLFGSMIQLFIPAQHGDHEFQWQKAYGAAYRLKGCFGEDRLMLSDPAAMQFIINNSKFEHSPVFHNLTKLLSDKRSLSVAKGDRHKRLRATSVRHYQPLMQKAAEGMSRTLENAMSTSPSQDINIYPMLATASLSSISEAVFGGASQDLIQEFVRTNTRAASLSTGLNGTIVLIDAVGSHLPEWVWDIVTLLPTAAFNILRRVKHLARRIGKRVVREKMDAISQGLEMENDVFTRLLSGKMNMTLTDEDVAAQTSLFLIAGQEPAAHTMAFGIYELSRNPDFQDSLRREIHSARGSDAGVVYGDMPLLNAFIKEILRMYPIGPLIERVATEDTIPIQKGQVINLAIASYQRLESLWGIDAGEFKPLRWVEGSAYRGEAIGPYANLLTFLGGPRTCLGCEFNILEMQVVFCELVANFSFTLAEHDFLRLRGSTILTPTNSAGQKGAPFRVTQIV
ncbi:cytochrome P450 [Roridomyces roridus]|uniref:Cytochrome P450 n=1 Tax=Roridomyces roridus TaxID=1738132 RepID=A0AAD7BZX2_9AGAR|nr:cytochrome P450 [Roridomyces roridus]